MNVTHLLAFHRVADAGSYSAAARRAGVSQPTLSAHVRSLEQAVNATLFERAGRGVRLTRHGMELFAATSKLTAALDEIGALLRRRTEGKTAPPLRISADSAVHVLPILAAMKRGVGHLAFALKIDNSSNVIAHVVSSESDIGVTARQATDRRLFSVKIREDRLVLLVPQRDALARKARVRLADIAGRDLVMREMGSITRDVTISALAKSKVSPRQILDVATREAVHEAVAADFGVGLVFASEAGNDRRLRAVALTDAEVSVSEYAICRVDRREGTLIAAFLETAQRLAMTEQWLGPQATTSA
jgi:molybdate transport repressor ModE-like protein